MRAFIASILVEFIAFSSLAAYVPTPQTPGTATFAGLVARPVTTAPTNLLTKRINSGGPAYTAIDGSLWEADNGCGQHQTFEAPGVGISGTVDGALYRDVTWGDGLDGNGFPQLQCNYTVPNGIYTVTLKFAEIYYGTPNTGGGADTRVFDIYINGTLVRDNYDTMATRGAFTVEDISFPNINVTNSSIQIYFVSSRLDSDNPYISAIQLTQMTSTGGGGDPGGPTKFLTATAGSCNSTNTSSIIQSVLNDLSNGDTLVFDCTPNLGTPVSVNDKQNITITATAGNGYRMIGSPIADNEMFRLLRCTGCTVKNMNIDVQQRAGSPMVCRECQNSTIGPSNFISNLSPFNYGSIIMRKGSFNTVIGNLLGGMLPKFQSPGIVQNEGYETRPIWGGEGSEWEQGLKVLDNIITSSGHTAIVCTCSNGLVKGNLGTNLVADGVKTAMVVFSNGTTIIENNEFHGSLAGWSEAGGERPVSGGGFQMGQLANPNQETIIIRNNEFDGGDQGVAMVGFVYNVEAYGNKMRNMWGQGGFLMTQRGNLGTVNVHHNRFDSTRGPLSPPTEFGSNPFPRAIIINAGNGVHIQHLIFDSNWISGAWQEGLLLETSGSGTITDVTVTNNAFVNNGSWGFSIQQGGGSISSLTESGNCFSGNGFRFGTGTLTDSRGIISAPANSSSCSNPSGVNL